MNELSAHEKFLRGIPLNPELEALREGRQQELPGAVQDGLAGLQRAPFEELERALTTQERLHLKEIRQEQGWPVLQRLLERACKIHVERAILLSEADPLANGNAIGQAWAYVEMFKRAMAEMNLLVEAELRELELEQKGEGG
jgi:hypothetical protein